MDPVLRVALGFALFAATHLALGAPRVRTALVARLGPQGFTLLFSLVAWLTFGFAVSTYAAHAGEGPAGLALGASPVARIPLIGALVLGVMLMTGAFARYSRSPFAIGAEKAGDPRGLERVTRHPFFVGLALFGVVHALLATHRVGAVAMGSLGLLAAFGAWFQDRKLLALRGESYQDYLAVTSAIPFAAILAGRQRLVWGELPYRALLLGVAIAALLRAVHAHLFDHGGAYLIAAMIAGPLLILLSALRRAQRASRSAAPRSAAVS
jgi:uncharacterized membrane protein